MSHQHGLVKAAVIAGTVAVAQGPARIAAYALLLRHLRRTAPELFDSSACMEAIAICLDEYQRESVTRPAARPRGAV